jgi:type I restriction enzyme M protein
LVERKLPKLEVAGSTPVRRLPLISRSRLGGAHSRPANVVRLYRGEETEPAGSQNALLEERFPQGEYADIKGLCKVATIEEIEAQGWSLNPGRYVGTKVEELDDEVFEEQLAASHAELRSLGAKARELEDAVDGVLEQLLSESS